MKQDIEHELAALDAMTTTQLCDRYTELFGQPVKTRHKAYLVRKIAWRIQALAEGDLSERARKRTAELANDADVRVMPPRTEVAPVRLKLSPTGQRGANGGQPQHNDPRIPAIGMAVTREYKGRTIRAIVREDGFEYEGQRYRTLTAVAEAVTGSHVNGFRFFRLENKI